MYKLNYKSGYIFSYSEQKQGYTANIDICQKSLKDYKGVLVICYQSDINLDRYNNAVGLRRKELLRLPFMVLHFKLYRLFHKKHEAG